MVFDLPAFDVVAINDIADSATMARLLRDDSTFGPFHRTVEDLGDSIAVDGHKIAVSAARDPALIGWGDHGVDVVLESTGKFRSRAGAAGHLTAGASRVVISAPGKDVDATIVVGEPVPPAALAALHATIATPSVRLDVLDRDQAIEVGAATDRSQSNEIHDDEVRAELRLWTTGEHPDGTGIPDASIPDDRCRRPCRAVISGM